MTNNDNTAFSDGSTTNISWLTWDLWVYFTALSFGFFFWIPKQALRRIWCFLRSKLLELRGIPVTGFVRSRTCHVARTHINYDLVVEYAVYGQRVFHKTMRERGSTWSQVDNISLWVLPEALHHPYTNETKEEYSRTAPLFWWMMALLVSCILSFSDLDMGQKTQADEHEERVMHAMYVVTVIFIWTVYLIICLIRYCGFNFNFNCCGFLSNCCGLKSSKIRDSMRPLSPSQHSAAKGSADYEELVHNSSIRSAAATENQRRLFYPPLVLSLSPCPRFVVWRGGYLTPLQGRLRLARIYGIFLGICILIDQRPEFYAPIILSFAPCLVLVVWKGYFLPLRFRLNLVLIYVVALGFFTLISITHKGNKQATDITRTILLSLVAFGSTAGAVALRHRQRVRILLCKVNLQPETSRFVASIKAFIENRGLMEDLAAEVTPNALVTNFSAKVHSSDTVVDEESSEHSQAADYQQQSIHGNTIQNLDELYVAAEAARDHLQKFLEGILDEVNNDDINNISFLIAPLKGRQRAQEKARNDYSTRIPKPSESWLYDILRCSILCKTEAQIIEVANIIQRQGHVIKTKNRFATPTCSGYRDLLLNIQLCIGEQFLHVCEIQIHHAAIKELNDELGSHAHYEYLRSYFKGSMTAVEERMGDLEAIASASWLDETFVANLLASDEIPRIMRLANLFQDQLGENHLSLELWQRVIILLEDCPFGNRSELAEAYCKIGTMMICALDAGANNPNLALQCYAKAFDAWKASSMGLSHILAAEAYHAVGQIYAKGGDQSKAMQLYKRALGIVGKGQHDQTVIAVQRSMALCGVFEEEGIERNGEDATIQMRISGCWNTYEWFGHTT